MARRRAVQRPRQPRQEENGNAPPIIRVSQAEMTAIEAEAVRLGISVSDLARIVIEAELQHQEAAQKRAARAARRARRRRDVIEAELDRAGNDGPL